MDKHWLDGISERLADRTPRRGLFRGLGALGLGSLGVLGMTEAGSAITRRCRRRCRRRCENRGPRCLERCLDRRCDD